jgi:S-DNA-T family DNA segregation ATPase FtsK/SpoIIIE
MQKAPKNKSLSWEILAAASPIAILAAMAPVLQPDGLKSFAMQPDVLRFAGLGCLSAVGIIAAHDRISDSPVRQLKVAMEYSGLYTQKDSGISLPRLLKKEKRPAGIRLTYSVPIGLCKDDFDKERARLEQAVNGEVSISSANGLLFLDVAFGSIPASVKWGWPEFPTDMILPVTIGRGRAGLIIADLADYPHLLVAGQTMAGKSVFLHQLIACLVHNSACRLFITDLTRADFAYMRRHAWFAHTVNKAHEILSYLVAELDRRLDLLEAAGVEKVQNYPGEMPYLVLIIDEFSHLSPILYKYEGKDRKEIRQECHSMLVDLLCRARKVGIHVILSTQRPDADVLPGQMKANIPATVCFQVRNRVNSQICLDNDKAASLPGIPGRAIYQFGAVEREVQTLLLTPAEARKLLPVEPVTHPGAAKTEQQREDMAGRF